MNWRSCCANAPRYLYYKLQMIQLLHIYILLQPWWVCRGGNRISGLSTVSLASYLITGRKTSWLALASQTRYLICYGNWWWSVHLQRTGAMLILLSTWQHKLAELRLDKNSSVIYNDGSKPLKCIKCLVVTCHLLHTSRFLPAVKASS